METCILGREFSRLSMKHVIKAEYVISLDPVIHLWVVFGSRAELTLVTLRHLSTFFFPVTSGLGPFSICAFPQGRNVALVHLCVTVSMIAFPHAGNYPRAETLLDERLFCAHVVHTDTMRMYTTLNLWRQWKCLATTKRILWFHRRVFACMEIHFFFRRNVRWNAPAETRIWKRGLMKC